MKTIQVYDRVRADPLLDEIDAFDFSDLTGYTDRHNAG
jgi:hypothetical protein